MELKEFGDSQSLKCASLQVLECMDKYTVGPQGRESSVFVSESESLGLGSEESRWIISVREGVDPQNNLRLGECARHSGKREDSQGG